MYQSCNSPRPKVEWPSGDTWSGSCGVIRTLTLLHMTILGRTSTLVFPCPLAWPEQMVAVAPGTLSAPGPVQRGHLCPCFFIPGSASFPDQPKTHSDHLWLPPDVKSWLIWKDPDAGKDWRQEEKGTTKDEMAGWHHWLDGHEFG